MPTVELIPHPRRESRLCLKLQVRYELTANRLTLAYCVQGLDPGVRIPEPGPAAQRDGLWRETCFEAFLQADAAQSYVELNFSPSSAWAAYAFQAYRQEQAALTLPAPPQIAVNKTARDFRLEVAVDLQPLPNLTQASGLRLGLSAVLLSNNGETAFWALQHPAERPDFHHPAAFRSQLSRGTEN